MAFGTPRHSLTLKEIEHGEHERWVCSEAAIVQMHEVLDVLGRTDANTAGLCGAADTKWKQSRESAVINIGVAWSLFHHFIFLERPQGDHGELCLLYISVFLALLVTGAGRYSLDELIARRH